MGSGKSRLGKSLADALEIKFYDTDRMIEESLGHSVAEIFEIYGEAYFRFSENQILQVLDPNENAIVATGGGMPMIDNNMDFLKENGMVIYLECEAELLAERLLKEQDKRPLLQNLNKADLKAFIENSLNERKARYEMAHMIYHHKETAGPACNELKDYLSLFL